MLSGDGVMDTFRLEQLLAPDVADQTLNTESISELTANALPAFIGITRTDGLGVVVGVISDCQGYAVAGAIGTVSSVQGEPVHLDEHEQFGTYYFSAASTSLPVRNGQRRTTNTDGRFVVIELPEQDANAWIQVWGFITEDDLANGELQLVAELPTPVLADAVVILDMEPLRTE
jgi:hypothetical protein